MLHLGINSGYSSMKVDASTVIYNNAVMFTGLIIASVLLPRSFHSVMKAFIDDMTWYIVAMYVLMMSTLPLLLFLCLFYFFVCAAVLIRINTLVQKRDYAQQSLILFCLFIVMIWLNLEIVVHHETIVDGFNPWIFIYMCKIFK